MFGEIVGLRVGFSGLALSDFGRAETLGTKFGLSDCSAQIANLRCLDVARAECQMLLSAAPADIGPAISSAGKREGCVGVEGIEMCDDATNRGCVRERFFSITEHQ